MDNRLVSPTPTSSKYTERRRLGAYKTGQEPAYKALSMGRCLHCTWRNAGLLECWGCGVLGPRPAVPLPPRRPGALLSVPRSDSSRQVRRIAVRTPHPQHSSEARRPAARTSHLRPKKIL
jgi:hypothetical protein